MKLIHTGDKEWRDVRDALAMGSVLEGAFTVLGPTEEIVEQVQLILAGASLNRHSVRYFLCSGSRVFRVPCYVSFENSQMAPSPIKAHDLLAGYLAPKVSLAQQVVSELEKIMSSEIGVSQLVLIEYMTPPGRQDLSFTQLVLRSASSRHLPVMIFVHQLENSQSSLWQEYATVDEILPALYLCGGRIRENEWHKITGQPIGQITCNQLITSRQIGSDSWYCYANRRVAELAESTFSMMDQQKKHDLARRILQALPPGSAYPWLAIASETNDLGAILSGYSARDATNMAVSEPEVVKSFFEHLEQIAQAEGDFVLAGMANINYLASLLYVDSKHAIHIYERLHGVAPDNLDQRDEVLFWFVLGQHLALMENIEAWEYAAACFRLSRASLRKADNMSHVERQWGLAMLANGEALIAFKLQQGDKARQIEEAALAELKNIDASLSFQAHIRTNLGDVLLRMFGDVEAAITQYEEALLASLHTQKRSQHSPTEQTSRFGQRIAQKLSSALIQAGRYKETIQLLTTLLSQFEKAVNKRGEIYAIAVLKARLALAQAYLKAGQERSAAVCYWRILRQPAWLEPDTLRDVVAKLRSCRPGIPEN
ncbi:MAG: hypothetical protein ACJ8AG_10245, partial [Ktedonobacteraceae bacterium]